MAVPSKVIALSGDVATVESFGVTRTVNLMLLEDPVAVGDYLIIQSGAFAVERLSPEQAADALDYFATVLGPAASGAE
jgi:hydrogenase expression/formation protein HypC